MTVPHGANTSRLHRGRPQFVMVDDSGYLEVSFLPVVVVRDRVNMEHPANEGNRGSNTSLTILANHIKSSLSCPALPWIRCHSPSKSVYTIYLLPVRHSKPLWTSPCKAVTAPPVLCTAEPSDSGWQQSTQAWSPRPPARGVDTGVPLPSALGAALSARGVPLAEPAGEPGSRRPADSARTLGGLPAADAAAAAAAAAGDSARPTPPLAAGLRPLPAAGLTPPLAAGLRLAPAAGVPPFAADVVAGGGGGADPLGSTDSCASRRGPPLLLPSSPDSKPAPSSAALGDMTPCRCNAQLR